MLSYFSTQDILPILLSPSPSIPLLVSSALSSIAPPASEPSACAQLQALLYAVRWDIGITSEDFLGNILEGERWLVWAAGNVCVILLPPPPPHPTWSVYTY